MDFRANAALAAKIRVLLGICCMLGVTQGWSAESPGVAAGSEPTDSNEVTQLLMQASAAVSREQFIYPARGSAMSLYHEVLTLEPGNGEALQGLETLVEHYLSEASVAIAEQRYTRAHGALSRARMIDRSNPNIEPIAAELRLLEEAERIRTVLDWRLVAERSNQLAPVLQKAGRQARQDGCRAIISVGSDAEGRWVYQQMSNAPGDRRIRAQIRIASPSAVEVLCFAESAT